VWVNWPHLTFALVTGVSDEHQKFIKQYDSSDSPIIKGLSGCQSFAYIIIIIDGESNRIYLTDISNLYVSLDATYNAQLHKIVSKNLIEKHLKFKGIRLDEINVVLWAKSMEGRKLACNAKGEVVGETQV
jgi:hypothetical protein